MWTVVYMTQDKDKAAQLQKLLEDAGLLVKLRPIHKAGGGEGSGSGCYEILVPESEVPDAHEIIIENGI